MGKIMTDECIESMIDNRTIIQCMQLAEKYNSDIVSKRHLAHQKAGADDTHMRQQWHPLPIRKMRHLSRGDYADEWKASYLTIEVKGVN